MKMRLTAYILFLLWLFTAVLSHLLKIGISLSDNSSLELTEKASKEKPCDEKDGENEKESEDKSEKKSEKETKDKFFELQYYTQLLGYLYSSQRKDAILISTEQYICTYSIELDSPPPEFNL